MTVEDLTAKQTAFVDAIIGGANGAAAYVTAGYTAPNINTATAGASRLLANVKVSTAIAFSVSVSGHSVQCRPI